MSLTTISGDTPHTDAPAQPKTKHIQMTATTHVSLTHEPLPVAELLAFVKSRSAGAVVVFEGTTRDFSRPEGVFVSNGLLTEAKIEASRGSSMNVHAHTIVPPTPTTTDAPKSAHINAKPIPASYVPITSLTYTSYAPLALRTLHTIATTTLTKHNLTKVAIAHRLGTVPVGEESVLVAVSAVHRGEAFQGAEEALEEVKKRVEVWKWEVFVGEEEGKEGWRRNVWDDAAKARDVGADG